MRQAVKETSRDAILVEDAHVRPMMGFEILEPLPARSVPYERVDPFILVHEARFRLSASTPKATSTTPARAAPPSAS